MSATVPPTPPASLATALGSAQVAARGTVTGGPASAALTQGQSLPAQVVASGGGQIVLTTTLGRITVQSNAALAEGTPVLLQVQSVGEAVRVSLHLQQNPTTAHGAGHGPGSAPASSALPGSASPAALSATPVLARLTEGSVLPATVTRAAASPATATPGAPTPVAPTPGALPAASAPPGATPAPAGTAPAPQAASSAATPTALAAGANLTVRVLAAAPPGGTLAPAPSLAGNPGARIIAATVTGHQAGGGAGVTAGTAELTLPNAHPLPTGSRLLLEVVSERPPLSGPAGTPPSFLTGRWEALNEALTTLQRIDPALVQHAVETAIPNPGPRMGATMLFFLSALFSGDVRRFLGSEAIRQLGRGASGLADRVNSEFGQLQRTATDANGQDWRLYLIPILTEDGLDQLRLLVRPHEEDERESDTETGTRFMIEVDMSRLGPIQFDGLTRKKQLDLVVRTQRELPSAMRDDIRSIFGNTVSALGFTGSIGFRVVPRFEITPVDQAAAGHKDLTV